MTTPDALLEQVNALLARYREQAQLARENLSPPVGNARVAEFAHFTLGRLQALKQQSHDAQAAEDPEFLSRWHPLTARFNEVHELLSRDSSFLKWYATDAKHTRDEDSVTAR